MKNLVYFVGITAIVAVIGIGMMACEEPNNDQTDDQIGHRYLI